MAGLSVVMIVMAVIVGIVLLFLLILAPLQLYRIAGTLGETRREIIALREDVRHMETQVVEHLKLLQAWRSCPHCGQSTPATTPRCTQCGQIIEG